jgi:hypothetical protein
MKTRRNSFHATLYLVVIAAVTTMSGASFAKDDARLAGLKAAEAARFQANVDADAKVLGQLLDDDLEYVHSNGEVDTKQQFIASLTSGARDYVATTFEIQAARILGDVAILRGTAKVKVVDHGNTLDIELGYTDVWVWKSNRWQMTAWRSARMPAATPAPAK